MRYRIFINLVTLNLVAIATLVCSPISAFHCLPTLEPHSQQRLLSYSNKNRVQSVFKFYQIQNQRNNNQRIEAAGSTKKSCCEDVTDDIVQKKSIIIPRSTFLSSIVSTVATVTVGTILNPIQANAAYIDPATSLPTITRRVYLDILLPGATEPDRIIIGLFGENLPRTVDNFVRLCTGVPLSSSDSTILSYAGTNFYRIISDTSVQGGAVGDESGKTGLSSFEDGLPFVPDNFNIRHSKQGLVSMVRSNPSGVVDSRFFINTSEDAGWADDRYAAFGIVEQGMDTIHKMESVKVQRPQNSPVNPIRITASGVLPDSA